MREEALVARDAGLRDASASRPVGAGGSRRWLRDLRLVAGLDIAETLRARWFAVYSLVFGAVVVLLFVFGLTESRILGFLGLTRLLVTYVQICMAILPIFVLITTVRSVAGDREAGVFEYLLSLPVTLGGWYGGRLLGRFALIFLPVLLAMLGAAGWATFQQIPVPWTILLNYAGLLASQAACFLGIGMLLSAVARSVDVAQGAAFLVWLALILFLDLMLLGLLVQERVSPEVVVGIAVFNPLQVFRTAAMMLFDPELTLLGPSAFVLLDAFGRAGYTLWSLLYPLGLGALCAGIGFRSFRRGDLA